MLASPVQAKNYTYSLTIKGKNENKFQYHDTVKPLDEKPADIIEKQFVFLIGTEVVKKLRDTCGKLTFEIAIHNLKEEAKYREKESKNLA